MTKKIIIFFALGNVIYAQSLINQYIFSPDKNKISPDTTKQLFDNYQYKKNYFEKVRLSADFSEFSDIESEYAVRLYPKSSSEMKLEKSNYNLKKEQLENQYGSKDIKDLKQKYETILAAHYEYKLLQNIESMMEVYKSGIKSIKNNIQNSSDIENLSSISDKLETLKLIHFQKKHQYKNTLSKIKLNLTDANIEDIEFEIQNSQVFSADKIIELMLQNNYEETIGNSSSDQNNLYQSKLLENKLALKKIKDSITLESVELKYDDSKRTNKNLSLGLHVEIPLGESNNMDIINTKLKMLSLKNKISSTKILTNYKVSKIIEDIKFLHTYNQNIQKQSIEKQSFYKKYTKLEKLNSKFLVNLKKKNIEYKKDMITTDYQLHKKYLDFLYETNTLCCNAPANKIFYQSEE